MAKSSFKLNVKGINELMKSPEMEAHLQQAGEAVANAAGGEYGVRVHQASWTSIANVYPESRKAAIDNMENNTLEKGLGAAGLKRTKG